MQADRDEDEAPLQEEVKGAAGEAKKGMKSLGGGEGGPSKEVDPRRAQIAMKILVGKLMEHAEQVKAKNAALSAIVVKKEDVAFLTANFFLTDKEAERVLKEAGGSRAQALDLLLNVRPVEHGKRGREAREGGRRMIYA